MARDSRFLFFLIFPKGTDLFIAFSLSEQVLSPNALAFIKPYQHFRREVHLSLADE